MLTPTEEWRIYSNYIVSYAIDQPQIFCYRAYQQKENIIFID